jgi:hypothetical protein
MGRRVKKIVSLHDHKAMMALLKDLYGSDTVKDDQKVCDTDRAPGTKGASEVVKLPSDIA